MTTSPKVSVVIGSYNRRALLEVCIEAVRKELASTDHEIIVVDGGSTDGAVEWLTRQKDIIAIIQHNRGEWAGKTIERKPWAYFMNLAFKAASGKFVCMLSDDSLIVPGAINNGLVLFEEQLARKENTGAVAFYFRDFPLRKRYAVAVNVGNLYVNHGLYLNDAMREVGYCDENYHFYFADSDLCMKLRQAGYGVIASEASFVEHYFEATPEIRASNNDARKDADRNRLIDKWAGIGYPEEQRVEFQKIVGYWREHETGFEDPDNTIQRLIEVSEGSASSDASSATSGQSSTAAAEPPNGSPERATGSSPLAGFLSDAGLWDDILHADRFMLEGQTEAQKLKLRDIWLADLLRSEYRFPRPGRTGALFFRSMMRKDYRQLFHAVIDASGISDRIVFEDYHLRIGRAPFNVDASRFMAAQHGLLPCIAADSALDRICLFIRACKYAYILSHLERLEFEALICFADMQPVEHLATRYFRERGVRTVTMQHGLYIDYGTMNTVNRINYLHQPSEYFLSWGPDTSRLIDRYHGGRKIVECGKPVVFASEAGEAGAKPYISVFLDQQIFNDENEAMLRIVVDYARASGHDVRVRFHPSINKGLFFEKFPMIEEQLRFGDADFVVGHTSSLLYEALTVGKRVMRFATSVPALELPESCTFSSLEELRSRIRQPQPPGLEGEFFCATGNEASARYAQFFRTEFPGLVTANRAPAIP